MTNTKAHRDWWRKPDWTRIGWRTLIIGLLLVSIGGCIWQSFTTIRQHAIHVGWDEPNVLPVIVDAFLVATLAAYWRKPGWFTGAASAIAALVTSTYNGLAYALDPASAHLVAPLPIVIVTGLTAPLFAVAIVHYLVYEAKPAKRKDTNEQKRRGGDELVSGDGDIEGAQGNSHQGAPGDLGTGASDRTGNGHPTRDDRPPHAPPRHTPRRKPAGRRNSAGPPAPELAAWLDEKGYQRGTLGRHKLAGILTEQWPDVTDHRTRQVLELWNANGHDSR